MPHSRNASRKPEQPAVSGLLFRLALFAAGILLILASWARIQSGKLVFDNHTYRQTTFAWSGYGVGALLCLLAFLPAGDWVYRRITTKKSRLKKRR